MPSLLPSSQFNRNPGGILMVINRFRSVAFLMLLAGTPALADTGAALRVSGGDVTVTCPLTVGGAFEARTKAVSGDVAPGADNATVTGAVRVRLDTLETGIGLRDEHMRNNYLEVAKGE